MAGEQGRRGFEVIWLRPERAARGPRPAHSRDEIATAAVRVADTEGVEAVSMRRIAAELGTGTTSLYRYVTKKEELYELMIDAALGDVELPVRTGELRTDLTALAHSQRAGLLRHPWAVTVSSTRPGLGPNQLRWMELASTVAEGHGLDADERLVLLEALGAFVTGYVTAELAERADSRRTGQSLQDWMNARGDYGATIIASGHYPALSRIMIEAQRPHKPNRLERGFQLCLERILDGLASTPDSAPGDECRA